MKRALGRRLRGHGIRTERSSTAPSPISQRSDLGVSFEAQLAEELGLNGEQSAPTALVKGKKRNELGKGATAP